MELISPGLDFPLRLNTGASASRARVDVENSAAAGRIQTAAGEKKGLLLLLTSY